MSANKRKGDAFEREVARVLREHGWPLAERLLGLGRHRDDGDIANLVGFHVDCKARADTAHLSVWIDEVCRECPGGSVPVVVVKRRGKAAERAYVVIELATFAELVRELVEQ